MNIVIGLVAGVPIAHRPAHSDEARPPSPPKETAYSAIAKIAKIRSKAKEKLFNIYVTRESICLQELQENDMWF